MQSSTDHVKAARQLVCDPSLDAAKKTKTTRFGRQVICTQMFPTMLGRPARTSICQRETPSRRQALAVVNGLLQLRGRLYHALLNFLFTFGRLTT
mmetsp:Transcript_31850/g.48034  ORF Transcript_31850/g.48034 Transcript_31850/m.48034 type:complete len:95 (-) Transcript_31850:602-886(-)